MSYSDVMKDVFRHPNLLYGELRKHFVNFNKYFYNYTPEKCTKPLDRDWDNLIILDAARYDIYSEVAPDEGDLSDVRSVGETSRDFIHRAFVGKKAHDTVYITANPYYELLSNEFHAIIPLLDKWDEKNQTVMPEKVHEAALKASKDYPNKRLIIHYMQPHIPFIGEYQFGMGWTTGVKSERDNPSAFEALQYCKPREYDITDVWEGYKENHKIAARYAKKTNEKIGGKSVVTADHANLLGERLSPIPVKAYGHISGIRHPALVTVPWHELSYEHRREIVPAPPEESADPMDKEERKERLEALGYM